MPTVFVLLTLHAMPINLVLHAQLVLTWSSENVSNAMEDRIAGLVITLTLTNVLHAFEDFS